MKKFRVYPMFVGLVFSLLVFSCSGDEDTLSPEEQLAEDLQLIESYANDRGLDYETTSSGIHYVITDSGNLGEHPSSNASVEVLYKGYFLDGRVFDQTSGNKTATFGLNQVIQGWQEAIPLLTRDGKGTFIMPSVLCYGSRGSGSIPPNSVLVFDIELIDFQ
jgi:FKBP-type peptidyl-prolyl cis-trans isomerase FkpA